MINRALSLIGLTLVAACGAPAPADTTSSDAELEVQADVQAACQIVETKYIYFDKVADVWPQVCEEAEALALSGEAEAGLAPLELLVDALHDPHVQLNTNTDRSPRLLPSGADFWLDGDEVVAIRRGSSAAQEGFRLGDKVTAINGVPLDEAAAKRVYPSGHTPSAAHLNWARNAAAAGNRGTPRSITLEREGRTATIPLTPVEVPQDTPPIEGRMVNDDIAYIRVNNSLGDDAAVPAFDAELERLKAARAWILDLRDTPGGGNTSVAEPMMGRFISAAAPYQLIRPKDEPEWQKMAEHTGDWTVDAPLIVLVGRWTGSMGEGMAIGFDGLGRGHVIGSDMARLAGGTEGFELPKSGISLFMPTYDLAHIDGTPRHLWSPPQLVNADTGRAQDDALSAAMQWIAAQE